MDKKNWLENEKLDRFNMTLMKYKLVYIEWEDACSKDTGWEYVEDAIRWAKEYHHLVREVGWLIDETSKYILLSNLYIRTQAGQVGGVHKIPKGWIRKRKVLKA